MLEKFGIDSLKEMDGGRVRITWEQLMNLARLDCEDRPGEKSARKVALVAIIEPVTNQAGDFEYADVRFEFDHKFPKKHTATYRMKSERGGLFFNDLSKDNPDQGTLDGVRPKATKGSA